MPRISTTGELEKRRQEVLSRRDPRRRCFSVCAGTGCLASGATQVVDAFKAEIEKQGL